MTEMEEAEKVFIEYEIESIDIDTRLVLYCKCNYGKINNRNLFKSIFVTKFLWKIKERYVLLQEIGLNTLNFFL